MTYKCPSCVYTAEMAGTCPTCNAPLQEVAAEATPEVTPEATPETPSTDAPAATE